MKQIMTALLLIALQFSNVYAQIADRSILEDDRESAALFAKQWAVDYLNYLAIAEVSPIKPYYIADAKTVKNVKCRMNCVHVYFLEEESIPNSLNACAIVISHNDWEEWDALLGNPALKIAQNHQGEGKIERFMKFIGKITDLKKFNLIQNTRMQRNLSMEKAMGRDCL